MSRRMVLLLLAVAFAHPVPADAATNVLARCHYAGVTTVAGQFEFVYAGGVAAASTDTDQPYVTSITCRMVSPEQPGFPGTTVSDESTQECTGAVCATAGTAGPWPVRPPLICWSASVTYYPSLATETISETCSPGV